MLLESEIEVLTGKILELLAVEGMRFESAEMVSALKNKGCTESPSGRIRIPREVVDEFTEYQKKTQEQDREDQELHFECGIDWAHSIIWHNQREEIRRKLKAELLVSAFDCGPTTYYDFPREKIVPVDTEVFTRMMRFAQATSEIGYTSTWYRQDVAPQIERIESLAMGARITDKLDGIEAIFPEVIKYLAEASTILTGRAGDSSYLAGSECVTPPMIMEARACEDMLERRRCGVHRYHIASMPAIGMNTPVSVAGSIVMGAAEILAGEVAAWCIDPESDISGRMIALVTDMRTATPTCTGPEVAMVNLGVREVFEACFGGHLWVEVFLSPAAKRPGMQAVFENFLALHNYTKWLGRTGIPYPGMGALHNGGLGSPTQFMLDLEIRKAQWQARRFEISEETLDFEEVRDRTEKAGNFLTSEHTLRHCRELWNSRVFLPTESPAWNGSESCILTRCEQMWRANLEKYAPPHWSEDQLAALDALVLSAKKEFGIA
jgi:trimethylamine:corrinoid methyltransferase-like protein